MKSINNVLGTLIILSLLFLGTNVYLNCKILEQYQTEIKELRLQVEDLRWEHYQLEKQIKKFVDKWNVEIFEVTAYSPYDDRNGLNSDGRPHITSTGSRPAPGTVAVNPEVIPYGTRLWIQGYGWGIAADTGAAIRKRTDLLDVFQWTYEEAMKWGRRKVVVVWQN